jgi:hypothetical protein
LQVSRPPNSVPVSVRVSAFVRGQGERPLSPPQLGPPQSSISSRSAYPRPAYQTEYPKVCVTSRSTASGLTASQFLGQASHQASSVWRQYPEFVSRTPRKPVMRNPALGEFASSSPALVPSETPRDVLPGMFTKQRQAASSIVFKSMRRRFANPSVG